MKQLSLLILCCISLVFNAYSQELTVRSMRAVSMDLSARVEPRKDLNDEACALIKVQLLAQGAVFEGNLVGDCDYRINEYWVYMTHGSKTLRIKHPNYLTLDINFSDYLIDKLESRTTYSLVIVLPHGNTTAQITAQETTIVPVESQPIEEKTKPSIEKEPFDSIPEPVPMNLPPLQMKKEVFKKIHQANTFANKGDWEKAISLYSALALYFPSYALLQLHIAKVYDAKYQANVDPKLSLNGAISAYTKYIDLELEEQKTKKAKVRLLELKKIKGQ